MECSSHRDAVAGLPEALLNHRDGDGVGDGDEEGLEGYEYYEHEEDEGGERQWSCGSVEDDDWTDDGSGFRPAFFDSLTEEIYEGG